MIIFPIGLGILFLFIPIVCFPLALIGVHEFTGNVGHWDEEPGLVGLSWMGRLRFSWTQVWSRNPCSRRMT